MFLEVCCKRKLTTRKGKKKKKFKSHTITSISNTFNKVGIPLQYQGFKAEILTLHTMYI